MLTDMLIKTFDTIYTTDLVYIENCWRLCGDAHCCSFSRYKSRFKLIGRTPFQELPLLPGEFEYLQHKGWLSQFGDHQYKVIEYEVSGQTIKAGSIVSRRSPCACEHDIRPTVCRLYPLLPVFDLDGRIIRTDTFGVYEELEQIEGLAPACQLTGIPFTELEKFYTITREIGENPTLLFYMEAYRITKDHVCARLEAAKRDHPLDVFTLFERLLIRKQLIDHSTLRLQLSNLVDMFINRYGSECCVA